MQLEECLGSCAWSWFPRCVSNALSETKKPPLKHSRAEDRVLPSILWVLLLPYGFGLVPKYSRLPEHPHPGGKPECLKCLITLAGSTEVFRDKPEVLEVCI